MYLRELSTQTPSVPSTHYLARFGALSNTSSVVFKRFAVILIGERSWFILKG